MATPELLNSSSSVDTAVVLEDFSSMLVTRYHEVDGPLMETLQSCSDFQVFKEFMLAANCQELSV